VYIVELGEFSDQFADLVGEIAARELFVTLERQVVDQIDQLFNLISASLTTSARRISMVCGKVRVKIFLAPPHACRASLLRYGRVVFQLLDNGGEYVSLQCFLTRVLALGFVVIVCRFDEVKYHIRQAKNALVGGISWS
jgi:hypothetical protein